MMPTPDTCPNCGADLPRNARTCPECGSDEETGWSEAAESSHLDLPDDSFDYDKFVENEFGGEKVKPPTRSWFWWVVAVMLLLVVVGLWLGFSGHL